MVKLPFYVISDTHWFHKNIIKFCNRPYDHETMMVKRWSKVISPNDVIVHLGDLFFGGHQGYEDFKTQVAPSLTGKKYIVLGNHDKKVFDYEALGFTVIKPFTQRYRGYEVSFDHYPKLLPEGDRKVHVHGHIHNNGYARNEPTRWGNINCSVEVLDYRPHRCARLINGEIRRRNQRQNYRNSKGYRCRKKA
jgi:calcineurin-like phosphoesterase family protein